MESKIVVLTLRFLYTVIYNNWIDLDITSVINFISVFIFAIKITKFIIFKMFL